MKRFLFLILALVAAFVLFVSCGDGETCEHSGGKATCSSPAICELCGSPYGELDADNHSGEEGWLKTAKDHTTVYLCCSQPIDEAEDHDWVMGYCRGCGYACTHSGGGENYTGGEANCSSGAICYNCGMEYTEKDEHTHVLDTFWEQGIKFHKNICKGCTAVLVEEEPHDFSDGVCLDCEYTCEHVFRDATCVNGKICEICLVEQGEPDAKNHASEAEWDYNAKTHTKEYPCCGAVEIEDKAHNFKDGICVDCRYGCNHTGGVATCTNRAICEKCGAAYGEKNPDNHSGTLEIISKTYDSHKYEYTCCETVIKEGHSYVYYDGICSVCGFNHYETDMDDFIPDETFVDAVEPEETFEPVEETYVPPYDTERDETWYAAATATDEVSETLV